MVKKIKILGIIFFIFISSVTIAQERMECTSACVDSLVKFLKTNTTYYPVETKIVGKIMFLEYNEVQDTLCNDKVYSWISKVKNDNVKAYVLSDADNKCYILSSLVKQATGLAVNFTSWIIAIKDSSIVFEFESLSDNPKLIYFDQETGKLNFFRITYGEIFFWERDWDNVDIEIELNEIDSGEIKTNKITKVVPAGRNRQAECIR